MIKAIIVDDSPQARRLLFRMLQEFCSEIHVCAEAENVPNALIAIKEHLPDLVFLDIEMPGKNGLALVEELSKQDLALEVIFTTAYQEYAVNAFRLSAIDYLLKPLDENQLVEAIEKFRTKKMANDLKMRMQTLHANMGSTENNTLCIPVLNGYEYIPLAELEYIEAEGSYVNIFAENKKKLTVSKNLKYFENALGHVPYFLRVHRSYIVNLRKVKTLTKGSSNSLILTNGAEIDVARDRRALFLEKMETLFS